MIPMEENKGLGMLPNPLINWEDPKQLNAFAMLSANLLNFLPNLPIGDHQIFYNSILEQQVLNGNDIVLFEDDYPFPIYGWDNLLLKLKAQNGIIATYHFGPFQLINYLLIKSEVSYALLVGPETIEAWNKRYPRLIQEMKLAEEKGRFQLLDAADKASLIKMYRLMNEGFNLLIYVDGLEGLSKNANEELHKVNFLGQEIAVPKGAAVLSNFTKLPIYPVLFRRSVSKINIELDKTIFPTYTTDRNSYIQSTSDRLYAFLSRFVMHWPEQWMNWTMLHRFLAIEKPMVNDDLILSFETKERYGLLMLDKEGFLLEKHSYTLYSMDLNEFNELKKNWL